MHAAAMGPKKVVFLDEFETEHNESIPIAENITRTSSLSSTTAVCYPDNAVKLSAPENLSKRPRLARKTYVNEEVRAQLSDMDVLETTADLPKLVEAPKRPTLVVLEEVPDTISAHKLDMRMTEDSGFGLFVKEGCTTEPGEVLVEYPGPPKWIRVDAEGQVPAEAVTQYVFSIGPFHVRVGGRKAPMSILFGWNITQLDDYSGPLLGHVVNTSHPLLHGCRKFPNCVYAVYANDLSLDASIQPNVRLFVVSATCISGGMGAQSQHELRTEYHWCLAYHFGFWCLNLECKECLNCLRDFVMRVHPPPVNKCPIASSTGVDFVPTAAEVLKPPFPKFRPVSASSWENVFAVDKMAADGNCLFYALSMGVYERRRKYTELKRMLLKSFTHCTSQLESLNPYNMPSCYKHLTGRQGAEYVAVLSTDGSWGTLDHILSTMYVFRVAIYVWKAPNDILDDYVVSAGPWDTLGPVRKVLHILHSDDNHYDFLRPNKFCSICPIPGKELVGTPAAHQNVPDESVALRRSMSTATGSSSGSSGSRSSRSSSVAHGLKLTAVNAMDDVANRLGNNKFCCENKCIGILTDDYQMQTLVSEVFQDPHAVFHASRVISARKREHERGKDVLQAYKESSTYTTDNKGRRRVHVKPYITFFSQTGSDEVVMRKQVCVRAFNIYTGVSDSMYWRYMALLKQQGTSAACKRAATTRLKLVQNNSPETRQLQCSEYACVAFIRNFCTMYGEKISTTNEIRIAFPKNIVRKGYMNTFRCVLVGVLPVEQLETKRAGIPVGKTSFYSLWNNYCADIVLTRKKQGFAICDICKTHAGRDCNPCLNNEDKRFNREAFAAHLKDVQLSKQDYYERQELASAHPNNYMSLIIDCCDSNTTVLPNVKTRSKSEAQYEPYLLQCKLFGVRVHAYRRRDYMYLYPPFAYTSSGTNLTIESFYRTMDLEAEFRTANGYRWPETCFIQLDNTSKDNKNGYVNTIITDLIAKKIFKTVESNFLPVGHTHEDIDQVFSVITKELDKMDAYTYPQWEALLYNAFKDPWNKIHHVQFCWSVHDYSGWISQFMHDADVYQGYRSTAFHFKYYTEDRIELLDNAECPWVMRYMKYSFHKRMKDGKYFPEEGLHPLESWLREYAYGEPDIDNNFGLWYEKGTAKRKILDREVLLSKIIEFLRLPTNGGNEDDVNWWREFISLVPTKEEPIERERTWRFKLPDVDFINSRSKYTAIDLRVLDNVDPTPPPRCEFILSKYWTAAQKRDTLKLMDDMEALTKYVSVPKNSFVFFKTEDDWGELAKEQEGMDPRATSLPFTLGKTVTDPLDIPEGNSTIRVEVWYPLTGDPNGSWVKWLRKNNTGEGSPWILDIHKQSIILVDPQFHAKKGHSKVITAKTKIELSQIPGLGYSYLPGEGGGLKPTEYITAALEERSRTLEGARSREGKRKAKTMRTLKLQHERTRIILAKRIEKLPIPPEYPPMKKAKVPSDIAPSQVAFV